MDYNSTLNALDDCFNGLIDERKSDIIPLAQTGAFLNDTVNSSSDHSSSESLVFSSFSSTHPNLVLFLVSSFDFVDELEEILRLSFLCVGPSSSSSSSGDSKLSSV